MNWLLVAAVFVPGTLGLLFLVWLCCPGQSESDVRPSLLDTPTERERAMRGVRRRHST